MKIRAIVLAAALVVAGCAPDSGTVYDKQYYPSYSYLDYQCVTYGKNGLCTLRMPYTHYVPEYWALCIRNADQSGCKYVDQITWHQYERGQQYP